MRIIYDNKIGNKILIAILKIGIDIILVTLFSLSVIKIKIFTARAQIVPPDAPVYSYH